MPAKIVFFLCLFQISMWTLLQAADVPSVVTNTQPETHPLLSPEDALSRLNLPPGFRATLFASEPEIRQPIAMTFDAKGRLWVAENDTYAESAVGYDLKQSDRVLVFEDKDGDGRSDSRKVFWDQGHHLTSVEVGFGGVWVLCAPDLLFIPDRNNDDIPDGEPIVMLTGFNSDTIRHNIVNGLKWGPDGWLYGRQGITTTSFVGTPETPEELRTPLNCSMWRFHPVTRKFEVISHGTTNSWGHDWDERGELFFINTVIGHFWHVVPGAHLERMFGEDFNPHLYRLMPQTADHFHWNTEEKWSDIRKSGVTSTTDVAGGGHAHCGMMIYQGTNWPAEYRGNVFALNLHGRRINRDLLAREGAAFVATHAPDFATSDDLWFRGIELGHGPDGGVFVLDWSDIGECHENDGIHRTSGRIFKIVYGDITPPKIHNYHSLGDAQLVETLQSNDAWQHRIARRLLQERFVAGNDMAAARKALLQTVTTSKDELHQLRSLWALHCTGGVDDQLLLDLLQSSRFESIRSWCVEFLSQQLPPEQLKKPFTKLADSDSSGLVLLHLAGSLQRLPLDVRLQIAAPLVQRQEFANDTFLPLMIWYGIEPAVARHPEEGIKVLKQSQIPELQKFISRRISSDYRQQGPAVARLVSLAADSDDSTSLQILTGMQDALDGWRKAQAPTTWVKAAEKISSRQNDQLTQLVRALSVTFGDGRALDELRKIAADGNEPNAVRRNAIRALVTAQDKDSRKILQGLLNDRDLAVEAIRGLAVVGDDSTPALIVSYYLRFRGHVRPAAMETLASRPEYAQVLLQAVIDGKIPASEIPPFYVRQMRSFDSEMLTQQLQKLFPEWRHTSEDKEKRANELRALITESALAKANLGHGRQLFEKTCAACHKLYGRGGMLGPDLTGSQRSNLNYLLGNIVDPSAEVAEKFRMSILVLDDGRAISGVVQQENEETLVIRTPNEEITLLKEDIEARKNSKLSMMPERQLDEMTEQEVIDLFGYLMSKEQVEVSSK